MTGIEIALVVGGMTVAGLIVGALIGVMGYRTGARITQAAYDASAQIAAEARAARERQSETRPSWLYDENGEKRP